LALAAGAAGVLVDRIVESKGLDAIDGFHKVSILPLSAAPSSTRFSSALFPHFTQTKELLLKNYFLL
jgi:hypothetical protein